MRQQDQFLHTQTNGLEVYVRGDNNDHVDASGTNFVLNGTTLTFTATDVTLLQVGDYLMASCRANDGLANTTIPAFMVTAINGSDVTAEAIVKTSNIQSTPTSAIIAVPEWAPAQSLTADTTNLSPTLANVSPTGILEVGDWIKGNGIQANARITAINGTNATMNKNASASATGVSIFFGQIHSFPATVAAF